MITEKNDETNEDIPIEEMERIMELKYRRVYSERLARKVYVLIDWIEKPLFKKYKRLFGYTDIGWTVKHPKQLIRALIDEGVWERLPE